MSWGPSYTLAELWHLLGLSPTAIQGLADFGAARVRPHDSDVDPFTRYQVAGLPYKPSRRDVEELLASVIASLRMAPEGCNEVDVIVVSQEVRACISADLHAMRSMGIPIPGG